VHHGAESNSTNNRTKSATPQSLMHHNMATFHNAPDVLQH